jgi:redox-sensitive bicupin YhaK (pirin superfamily)
VSLPERARFGHEIPSDRTVFAYVIEGECYVGREKRKSSS